MSAIPSRRGGNRPGVSVQSKWEDRAPGLENRW